MAERYAVEDIETLRLQSGANKFTSQMMLVPVNVEDGHLDIGLLRRYSGEIDYTKEIDRLEIGGRRMVDCCAFWDPALAGKDSSVVAVIFIGEDYDIWLHRVVYLRKGSNCRSAGEPDQSAGDGVAAQSCDVGDGGDQRRGCGPAENSSPRTG